MLRRFVALVLASGLTFALASCRSQEKEVSAPAGDAFYTPPKDLSQYQHGDLIWSRESDSDLGDGNSNNTLVLYAQEGLGRKTVGTSGFVSVPKGKAPAGGWPVVTWAHGTTGIADQCAPTRLDVSAAPANSGAALTVGQLNRWLDAGYAVVGTDYEGLGTPGVHPYLIGSSEGKAVLDIVTAARELNPDISNRVLIAGHSQGGHAALWASSLAPFYARDLDVVGTLAIAPPSHLSLAAEVALSGEVNVPAGFVAMILTGLETAYPGKVPIADLVNERGQKLMPKTLESCATELFEKQNFGQTPMHKMAKPGADPTRVKDLLDANDPSFPTIKGPILIVQGTADKVVPMILTDTLAKAYTQRGFDVQYTKYRGAEHSPVLAVAAKQMDAFTASAFSDN
ncbi:MAG TPA: alpha/beta fold hydrolase [Aeromicrobium sp.]|nr:alpha/beta fold hydrolase [Aeromicrobium sp.]